MSDTQLADAAVRERIRTRTDETLFVDAGAGSGKTRALVERILTLVLCDGIDIQQIAAVTFTERAASELRERVRTALESRRGPDNAERVDAALDGLDLAAIGTLHAFAQRILVQHAIEAGIPPALEVLDPVASSIAADSRWRTTWSRLLDDADIGESFVLARALGVREGQIRQLFQLLGHDWDLLEEHVLAHPAEGVVAPRLEDIVADARAVLDLRAHCTDPGDRLLGPIGEVEQWLSLRPEPGSGAAGVVEWLSDVPRKGLGLGRKGSWTVPVGEVRSDLKALVQRATERVDAVADVVLRNLTRWCATAVIHEAEQRRRSGRLEFHDLLVLARDVLRRDPEVRRALESRYRRLLLDEFQDTDPIQIEIACRIVGGAEASQDDWRDIVIPPGALFVVGDPKQSIYRFRRADIRTYLGARQVIGTPVSLTTNFRTGEPIIDWVNTVFAQHIQEKQDLQPGYDALHPHRAGAAVGPAVTVLGAQEHTVDGRAMRIDEVRQIEAAQVAATIQQAIDERWTTQDPDGSWRPLRRRDITVLIPARTSLPHLEEALDAADIEYRAGASSLVYGAPEVRALFAAAHALADPSDELMLVTALRSVLFCCGDDDLWTWKRDGGTFNLRRPVPDALTSHPVGEAITYLRRLHFEARWLTPSAVLSRLAIDRRIFELMGDSPRARDSWRRLRYVIDQARAWAEAEHGGLRSYVAWAAGQAAESVQAAEAVLPESDVDAVRVMTVHAAKGLEFPMVIMSGLSSQPRTRPGVRVLWKSGDYDVKVSGDLSTATFEEQAPLDEQMDHLERARLMYVAATRARDHLVVSLHRSSRGGSSSAHQLVASGAANAPQPLVEPFDGAQEPPGEPPGASPCRNQPNTSTPARPGQSGAPSRRTIAPPPPYAEWRRRIDEALARTQVPWSRSASGLEGTEPDALDPTPYDPIAIPTVESDESAGTLPPGAAKGGRDLEGPAWARGRDGLAIGRAVHGVLQVVDLGSGDGLDDAVAAQCIAEGVTAHTDLVRRLAGCALAHPLVQSAAGTRHWREMFVGTAESDGQVTEGIIDLVLERSDRTLTIVDYKTDQVPAAGLDARVRFYRPQVTAYRDMVERATGRTVSECVLLFLREDGAVQRSA